MFTISDLAEAFIQRDSVMPDSCDEGVGGRLRRYLALRCPEFRFADIGD